MNLHYPWAQDFNITPEQIQTWTGSLDKGKSVIRWCIENNKLSSEEYFNWAKKHYQLPALKDSFQDMKTVAELRKRYSNIWPDHVCPIAEWDNTLFLVCLEPIADFQAPQSFQWVLAPLSQILKLRDEDALDLSSSSAPEGPAGLKLETTTGIDTKTISFEMPEGLSMPSVPDGLSLPSAPEGLSIPPAPEGLSLNSIMPPSPEPIEPKTRIFEMPEGLNAKIEDPMASKINTSTASSASAAAIPTPPPLPKPKLNVPPPIPNSNAAKVPPPIESATPIKSAAQAANSTTPPPIGQISESAIASVDDAGHFLLGETSKIFEKSMILLFKGANLEPWKWTPNWTREATRNVQIDLSTPSVFRIVNETKTPYHGYVIPNSINDAFFATWNKSQLPEHLTIVPVMFDKKLGGMLLGICTKSKAKDLKLFSIERLAEKASELLLKWGPAKAA